MKLSKVQRRILKACKYNPKAKDDDAQLLATYWEIEGWDYTENLKYNLTRLTKASTIVRKRRDLVSLGLIEPSKETQKKRQEAYRDNLEQYSSVNMAEVPRDVQERLLGLTYRSVDPQ